MKRILLLLAVVLPLATFAQDMNSIIDRYVQATGEAKMSAVRSYHEDSLCTAQNGVQMRIITDLQRPSRLGRASGSEVRFRREYQMNGVSTGSQLLVGERGWKQEGSPNWVPLAGSELMAVQEDSDPALLYNYAQRGIQVSYGGVQQVANVRVHRFTIRKKSGATMVLDVNAQTFLPIHAMQTAPTVMELVVTKHKMVNGIALAETMTMALNNGAIWLNCTLQDAQFDTQIADSRFLGPPDLAASAPAGPTQPASQPSRTTQPVTLSDELSGVAPGSYEELDTPPASRSKVRNTHAYALVIGAEKYERLPEVPFAINDATVVRRYLVSVLGIPESHVRGEANPTIGRLNAGIRWLSDQAHADNSPETIVYFYFAGHGVPDLKTKSAFLVPVDADPQYINETAYPLSKIAEALEALPGRSVVLIDACFTGAAARGGGGGKGLMAGKRPAFVEVEMPTGKKVHVLSAVSGEETSNALPETQHGLFTYYLLSGLKGKAADAKGQITLKGLYDYVRGEVSKTATRMGQQQTPTLTNAEDIVLGTVK